MPIRKPSPTAKTLVLAVGLALLCAGLTVGSGEDGLLHPELLPGSLTLTIALFTVLFGLAELALLHVEVRRQAYSITLAGVPLAAGLLLLPVRELIAARLLGSVVAFSIQRSPITKVGYNLAAYAAEAALDAALLHALLGTSSRLSMPAAITCLAVIAAGDQLMSCLVILVITWHQGRLAVPEKIQVLIPALVGSVFATTSGYAALLLIDEGALGVFTLAVIGAAATGTYRGYQTLHRRHRALEHVHDFVALSEGADNLEDLASRMLGEARSLMHASRAELLLADADGALHLSVDETGTLTQSRDSWPAGDWLISRVRAQSQPALIRRHTRDDDCRRWLAAHHLLDALIVPLPASAGDGALMLFDRLGDTGSFTAEDKSLLQTLAGHLSIAVRGSRLVDKLRYDSTHDSLTGLANRTLLSSVIDAELKRSAGSGLAVLILDLDGFKEVNDTLGHHVGDALLTVVGKRLRTVLPAGATVARLGGDEFAALIPGLRDPRAQALVLATELAEAIAQPVALAGAMLSTHASVGVSLACATSTQADLLRHADTAMYSAKGTDLTVVLYDAELDRGRSEQLALLADLHLALERDELHLLYQPKLDLRSGHITSVEALVRWQHPRLGLLGPDAFIPLAESTGLIEELTYIVLRTALRQTAAWQRDGVDIAVAVNLSARSLSNLKLPELISAALLEAGLSAHCLILEITEGSVMHDPERAAGILTRLAAIGITLSLDDFGTGYSSLAYLQRLPVQELKIDRSFITDLVSGNGNSEILVRSILGLANGLGLRVVAEGIEDHDTLTRLQELGCDLAQGYFIGRPMEAEHVAAATASHQPAQLPRLYAVNH